jgi:HD-like signal output (HDOD) protein
MKRVLFVDDDQNVLDGLKCRLRSYRTRWDMTFANGGQEALRHLDAAPFDVVVSDVQMPQMGGLAVLTHVRDRSPATARIVLSGATEPEVARRLATVAHQFLSKPCEPARLESVIERACRLQETLHDPALQALVTGIGQLPALPDLYLELTRMLAEPDVSMNEVAALIRKDVAITANVLHVVNSAFFGLPIAVQDVDAAVRYLGAEIVRSLVLMIEVFKMPGGSDPIEGWRPERIQRHSLAVARTAKRLVSDPKASQNAFVAGMLHDVGLLVLMSKIPERLRHAVAAAKARGLPFEAVEADASGITHAEIGAYLLGLWGLPLTIVESVAFHHRVSELPKDLDALGAVRMAVALVDEIDGDDGFGPHETRTQTAVACAEALGSVARLPAWRDIAAEETGVREPARA